jgi:flavin reductase (DIM6/NTAB) family NADH-FMN oxidoreductase RutF
MAEWTSVDLTTGAEAYGVIVGAVVPRPIGWVSTVAADGTGNLAPFSYFNLVSSAPPVLMVAPSGRRGAGEKDTLANVRAVPELVHHVVDEAHAEVMNATAAELPHGVDEVGHVGLATVASDMVRPRRLASAAVAMEARVTQIVPVGEGSSYHLILARIVKVHVRSDLLGADGRIDPERLRPIARLGGDGYTTLGRVFQMKRP